MQDLLSFADCQHKISNRLYDKLCELYNDSEIVLYAVFKNKEKQCRERPISKYNSIRNILFKIWQSITKPSKSEKSTTGSKFKCLPHIFNFIQTYASAVSIKMYDFLLLISCHCE